MLRQVPTLRLTFARVVATKRTKCGANRKARIAIFSFMRRKNLSAFANESFARSKSPAALGPPGTTGPPSVSPPLISNPLAAWRIRFWVMVVECYDKERIRVRSV